MSQYYALTRFLKSLFSVFSSRRFMYLAALTLTLLFSSLFILGEAAAAIYYMATNGSDSNNGSINSPWATIGHANSMLSAGDTLYIRAGTYTGQTVTWTASGSIGNIITIKAYTSETPIFDGNGSARFIKIDSQSVSYLTFDGLEITDYFSNAFIIYKANNITIKNCNIHDITAASTGAIWIGDASISTHNISIENNTLQNTGRTTEMRHDHAVYLSYNSSSVTIKNNYFKNCQGGPTITMGHTPAPDNIEIYNNIFYLTTGIDRSAIYMADSTTNVNIYNNTMVSACSGATYCEGITSVDVGSGRVAKNNIFYYSSGTLNAIRRDYSGTLTTDYNLYYPTKDFDDTGAYSIHGDPKFKDYNTQDFHLQTGSSAIDAGVYVGLTYDADGNPIVGAPDIGAYEYVGNNPPVYGDNTPPAAPKLY